MIKSKKSFLKVWLLASMGFASYANADFTFNGFASFVGGKFSEDTYEYVGYDNDFSFSPDTMVGIQVGSELSDKINVTAQLTAKGSEDYDIEAALAFMTYAANDDWDIRIGRIRAPFFYYSEFLEVGYAYPWIRPPSEVYGRIPFDSFEGIDTLYRSNHGDWSATWHAFYGNNSEDLDADGESLELNLDNFWGANVTIGNDWLTLRAGYLRADVTQENPAALAGFWQILTALGLGQTVNNLDPSQENAGYFVGLGAFIDYEDWLVNMEYTTIGWDNPTLANNDDAWFVMAGRRFDDIVVHLTYAVQEDSPDFGANVIPVGLDPQLDALHGALDSFFSNNQDTSITAGIRYELDAGVAMKLEVTQIDIDVAEPLFPGQASGFDDGTLVSFGVDVVF